MRRRQPGFYVLVESGTGGVGLPSQLFDGPWATPERARRRAEEIQAERGRRGITCRVVRVLEDGASWEPAEP